MRISVYGRLSVWVSMVVEVDDSLTDEVEIHNEAIDKASETFGGVQGFVGNGGTGKLIGVSGSDEAIYIGEGNYPEFEDTEVEIGD